MEFNGLIAVVTGGSNGIGSALCALLAERGATVASLDVAAPAKHPPGITHLHCDVTKLDDVRAALAQVRGPIGLLVNNAGVMRRGTALSHPEDEFDLLFSVNAKGPWLVMKEAAPLLSKHAVVLHVSSYRAGQDVDDPGLYAASKAAGEHVARCAASADPAWRLKIARLGRFSTDMAREGLGAREPAEAAELLLELAASDHALLSYDPGSERYSFSG